MKSSNTVKLVKRSPVDNYNGFAEAFSNLPNKHSLIVRRELQKRLKWSMRTFFNKRGGDAPLRENEVPIIQEIFERFELNAWTGQRL